MFEEIWVPVPGYDGLEASTAGHIRDAKTLQQPKVYITNTGYYLASCRQYGNCLVHRLVCLAFNPNPQNLAQVNHINANKLDNRPENLEWVSLGDNVRDFWHNPVHAKKQAIRKQQISQCLSGSIWITDGHVNHRIKPDRLIDYPTFQPGVTRHSKEVV